MRPSLLVTYNWGSIEWALANRVAPLAAHLHIEDGFGPDEVDRQLPRRVWMRRIALSGRSTVLVPSRTLYEIATKVWRLSPARVLLVPNGIDCDRFACDRRYGLDGDRPEGAGDAELTVGTVATLRAEKNIDRLLRIFAAVSAGRPWRLVIAGGGEELPRLRAEAEAMGLDGKVAFTGPTDRPEAVYAGLDIFALTSDTEQMPLSLVEAMASGLPVVATDVGDVSDLLSASNRPYVANPTDEEALAGHLRRLAAAATMRAELGQANAARARAEYALDSMVARYDQLFRAAIDQRSDVG